jgi:hypothetical protein
MTETTNYQCYFVSRREDYAKVNLNLTELAHPHIVVMDDLHGGKPKAKDGNEATPDFSDFTRNVFAPDSRVKVPVHVKVSLIVFLHQWLAFVLIVK